MASLLTRIIWWERAFVVSEWKARAAVVWDA